jgi:hypothetical protein
MFFPTNYTINPLTAYCIGYAHLQADDLKKAVNTLEDKPSGGHSEKEKGSRQCATP